jgi:hypothetical protein
MQERLKGVLFWRSQDVTLYWDFTVQGGSADTTRRHDESEELAESWKGNIVRRWKGLEYNTKVCDDGVLLK